MQHRRIIKQGPVVFATREDGSIDPASTASQGLFLADTRYLSRLQVRLNDEELVLLGSSEETLFEASYLLTNPPLGDIPARGIGILRHHSIRDGAVRISLRCANWSTKPVELELSVEVESDFFDSFETRGVKRLKRGEMSPPTFTANCLEMQYTGLDNVTRTTRITTEPDMVRCESGQMYFSVKLGVNQREDIVLDVTMIEAAPEGINLQPEPSITRVPKPEWFDLSTSFSTSNTLVEAVIHRSLDDLEVLLTEYMGYHVPVAGLPRFAVPFGRDGIVTSLQTLIWNPNVAWNVLHLLAKTQGTEENAWTYEQPGKIMHEMHTGELARLKEIPFGLFYGSVDSTPLFLVLGAEYIRWTGDVELFQTLKPNFEAAWGWLDHYGDIDGSGYVQYKAHTPPKMSTAALTVGLFNQGWKDSANSVVYSDGSTVTDHPVALAEVQGDLYRALTMWAEVYDTMPGADRDPERAERLRDRAARLKERFNREFWMPQKNYYAMALDGQHRQVDSITSNPGQCLWSRLIDEEHAEAVADTLLSDAMFTSWGIRTMANTEQAYNPLSYHNGSVWPFENALIAAGFKKYGLVSQTQTLFDAMIDSARTFEYFRWPEVFCGVGRETGGVLARQPDACRPQAWSSGAIFMLMQTLLGVSPGPFAGRVDITPALPTGVDEIIADNMQIAGSTLGLRVRREGNSVLLDIRHNPSELDVVVRPATRNHHQLRGENRPAVSG